MHFRHRQTDGQTDGHVHRIISARCRLLIQEASEKCWAHSLLRAAARRLFYIGIHQVSLLSHAACSSMSTTTSTTTTTTRDRGDCYGPIEWAQLHLALKTQPLFELDTAADSIASASVTRWWSTQMAHRVRECTSRKYCSNLPL